VARSSVKILMTPSLLLMVRLVDLFPSSDEKAGEAPAQLGPLERSNLGHCQLSRSLSTSSPEYKKRSS
jgi:hypothetical protein